MRWPNYFQELRGVRRRRRARPDASTRAAVQFEIDSKLVRAGMLREPRPVLAVDPAAPGGGTWLVTDGERVVFQWGPEDSGSEDALFASLKALYGAITLPRMPLVPKPALLPQPAKKQEKDILYPESWMHSNGRVRPKPADQEREGARWSFRLDNSRGCLDYWK